ncbi:hypothetical protein Tco_1429914 [Tanacetum coccineum]
MANLPPPNNDPNVPEDEHAYAPEHAPIAPKPAPIQPNDYLANDDEEEPISEQAPAAPAGFAPQWIGWQDPNNNNGWLDEDDDDEPEEDEADEDNNEELEEEGVGDGEEEKMESDDEMDNSEVINLNEAEKGELPPLEAATVGTGRLVSLTGRRLFTNTQVHMGSSSSATTGYNPEDLTLSHIRSDLNALHHRVPPTVLVVPIVHNDPRDQYVAARDAAPVPTTDDDDTAVAKDSQPSKSHGSPHDP